MKIPAVEDSSLEKERNINEHEFNGIIAQRDRNDNSGTNSRAAIMNDLF